MEVTKQEPQFEVYVGKTLLGNWVEERQVTHIDNIPKTIKEVHVGGHEKILTQTTDNKISSNTTSLDSYKEPRIHSIQPCGKKRALIEKELYSQISARIDEQLNQPPPSIDYNSTTKKDFTRDYTPIEIKSTMPHDVKTEAPVTFWSQNIKQIDGVTQLPSEQSPFKKNAAFSTPIHEYKDTPKPHEEWNF